MVLDGHSGSDVENGFGGQDGRQGGASGGHCRNPEGTLAGMWAAAGSGGKKGSERNGGITVDSL